MISRNVNLPIAPSSPAACAVSLRREARALVQGVGGRCSRRLEICLQRCEAEGLPPRVHLLTPCDTLRHLHSVRKLDHRRRPRAYPAPLRAAGEPNGAHTRNLVDIMSDAEAAVRSGGSAGGAGETWAQVHGGREGRGLKGGGDGRRGADGGSNAGTGACDGGGDAGCQRAAETSGPTPQESGRLEPGPAEQLAGCCGETGVG